MPPTSSTSPGRTSEPPPRPPPPPPEPPQPAPTRASARARTNTISLVRKRDLLANRPIPGGRPTLRPLIRRIVYSIIHSNAVTGHAARQGTLEIVSDRDDPDAPPGRFPDGRYADTATSASSPGDTRATSSQLSPAPSPRSTVPSPRPAYTAPGASGSGQSA